MPFIQDLLATPSHWTRESRYTALNGIIYLFLGVLFILWPGAIQTLFRDRAFVGDEGGLFRVLGLTVVVIGWLYLFGGRGGGRQVVVASVIDRLIFVPVVLLPVAASGIFPHVLVAFTILDMSLAVGAWVLLARAR
jgi:hypothetical protein